MSAEVPEWAEAVVSRALATDTDLIVNMPPRHAQQAVGRVLALHRRSHWTATMTPYCAACQTAWPCLTIAALAGLGGSS